MIELVIPSRRHSLGAFEVGRVLPYTPHRTVGPFVFFDHMGPVEFAAGLSRDADVRPHPHIGLSTVSYLFEGEMTHRDSVGSEVAVLPGEVNWMTAGRGIVHSERTPEVERAAGHRMHGIQTWVALPRVDEEAEPEFRHYPANTLPESARGGVRLRVIAGHAFGMTSPVHVYAPTLYVDVEFAQGSAQVVPAEHEERAVYVVAGEVRVDGEPVAAERMLVLPSVGNVEITAVSAARILLCGGAALDGERFLWWNFVASDQRRIERAKADWLTQRFGQVPGETEFIPLPEH